MSLHWESISLVSPLRFQLLNGGLWATAVCNLHLVTKAAGECNSPWGVRLSEEILLKFWESKAVANPSERWKRSFFWQFKLEWIHLCWSVLTLCEGLSAWAAVRGEWRGKTVETRGFFRDFSCPAVWSTEPDPDVNTLQFRDLWAGMNSRLFWLWSQINRACGKTQKNSRHRIPQTSNCYTTA